jgi:hypothetical protein
MKRGEQGKVNRKGKGRTWMVTNNVIMRSDPYYSKFYRIKKAYLEQRPDLVHKKEQGEKGWKKHIDNIARCCHTKIILGHMFEVMYLDYNGVDFYETEDSLKVRHRNFVPRKDTLEEYQWELYHNRYKAMHDGALDDLRIQWEADKSENKEQYFEWLKHMELRKYYEHLPTK